MQHKRYEKAAAVRYKRTMRPQILYPLTFVLGLVSCNYVANKMSKDILDSFKAADKAVQASYKTSGAADPAVYIYNINLHEAKDTALAARGKAAYTSYRKMAAFLDSLHDVIDAKDNTPQKDDKTVTQHILWHTPGADRYKAGIESFVALYKTIPVSDSKKDSLKFALFDIGIHPESADWQSDYFKDQPTFAALTLFTGRKLQLENVCRLVLADIDERLK